MAFTFLLGGAKSGKSNLALQIAKYHVNNYGMSVKFIATAVAKDEEMLAKIIRHQQERPQAFTTVEESVDLADVLRRSKDEFVIIDCITLWVFNLLERDLKDSDVLDIAKEVAMIARESSFEAVIISNEVGSGIVPADQYTRKYRDLLGNVNQIMASSARKSYFVIAGKLLPLLDIDMAYSNDNG